MERFPEEHELISFFECEPNVLDPGIPWVYNHLEFRSAVAVGRTRQSHASSRTR